MNGIITVSDRAIAALAAHIAENTEGVAALADRSGKAGRGRVYITKDREVWIYIICRYGANTSRVCDSIISGIKDILGTAGEIRKFNVKITGVVK